MVDITSNCETIEAVLADAAHLRVPYFQRGYAWQEEHAERLLDDLLRHAGGEGSIAWYPLGAIIIAQRPGEAAADVADGHQRLITLIILLAVLRDRETGARRERLGRCILDTEGKARFSTLSTTASVLLRAVQMEGATHLADEDGRDLSPSEAAIIANRDAIRRRVEALTDAERLRLQDFVLGQTKLVVITVDDDKAARLLFATMHETGLRPESADLLKSRVLGRLGGDKREKAQAIWESLEGRLGRDRMSALLLNVAAVEARAVQSDPPDIAIGQTFDLETAEGAERFVIDRLRPAGSQYIAIVNAGVDPAATPPAVFRRLQYLSWVIRHQTWRIPALHWLTRHGLEHEETETFLARLESLAWTQMIIATESPRRDRRYMKLLQEIDSGRALLHGGALTVTEPERSSVRDILANTNIVRKPYKLFLLLRLNAIHEGDMAVTRTPEATVEHIFPQKPSISSRWLIDNRDSDANARLRHLLGNLTLLTEREQNLAGNRDFTSKREVYADSAFLISRELGNAARFGVDDIIERTEHLVANFMRTIGL